MRETSISAARTGASSRTLRRQALHLPGTIAAALVTQAIMQAILSLLPEFDLIGTDTIPSPGFWTRRPVLGMAGHHLCQSLDQRGARGDHRALPGNHSAETAP